MTASAFLEKIQQFFRRIPLFFREMNDDTVFAIWIAAVILVGSLVWGLSAGPRNAKMAALVNRTLIEIGDSRSLNEPVSAWRLPGSASAAGSWFIMSSRELALVGDIFYEGVFSPCLAIFNASGKIDSFLPLSRGAAVSMERGSRGYINVQISHIEKAAALVIKKLDGGL
ncbi:MAG: hypothetical protein LBD20_07050 [Spirochaetaceae bacterium]|nr:hypothetical protein [Spirochaetaceae bacterium]